MKMVGLLVALRMLAVSVAIEMKCCCWGRWRRQVRSLLISFVRVPGLGGASLRVVIFLALFFFVLRAFPRVDVSF